MLDSPTPKGETLRQILTLSRSQLAKAGRTEAELKELFPQLEPVEVPHWALHLLTVFAQLSNSRSASFNGLGPIDFVQLKAWCELMDEHLSPWEVEALRAMDRAYLEEHRKLNAKED